MADLHTWVVSYATGSLVSPEMQKQRLTWMTMPPMTPEHAYGIGIAIDHGWLGHDGRAARVQHERALSARQKAVIVVMVNTDIPSARPTRHPRS